MIIQTHDSDYSDSLLIMVRLLNPTPLILSIPYSRLSIRIIHGRAHSILGFHPSWIHNPQG